VTVALLARQSQRWPEQPMPRGYSDGRWEKLVQFSYADEGIPPQSLASSSVFNTQTFQKRKACSCRFDSFLA